MTEKIENKEESGANKLLKISAYVAIGAIGSYAFYKILKIITKTEDKKPPLYIDFDGTIATDEFPGAGPPKPYVKETLTNLRKKYTIHVYSCRTSSEWSKIFSDFKQDEQVLFIKKYMRKHKIPYDSIEMSNKPTGIFIGDENIEFKENWKEIENRLMKGVEKKE